MSNSISSKAMLASLSISAWSARRVDKGVTEEIHRQKNAHSKSGRYNKSLIDPEALRPLRSISNDARATHYSLTLPWGVSGQNILPAAAHMDYMNRMRDYRLRYEEATDAFVKDYPDHVRAARKTLGDIFSADDYPDESALREAFGFEVEIMPMPTGDHFEALVDGPQKAAIQKAIEESVHNRVQEAVRNTYQRVDGVLTHLVERLSLYDPNDKAAAPFRDTLIENLRELGGVLPMLNITDDPLLDEIAKGLTKKLGKFTPEQLRSDDDARQDAINEAEKMLSKLSGVIA